MHLKTMTKSKRNSLIEILRFFFALNVVKNHGYLPFQGPYFGPGRISVEFFFVLSGYLFVRSIVRYTNEPTFKGLLHLYKDKILGLGVPLFVGLGFNILSRIFKIDRGFSLWGYLWYVHAMLVVFTVFYLLRKAIKNDEAYWLTIALIGLSCAYLHTIPLLYTIGYFRAGSTMAIGMLITHLPKISEERKWAVYVGLAIVGAAILKIFIFNFSDYEDEILNLLLYPALVYLAFQVNFSNPICNYLGSLSFGLYAYQCVTGFIEGLGYDNLWCHFALILTLSILTDLGKRIYRHIKTKTQQQINTVN